ncbi:4-carboxymuconolactone decarboxylase [Malassezia brasiliensis]|uniref:4-carboxymuconolactone decarboxylase n=1 Tax=Malassezia brasiliensis TaxID=1821822 RepID=A0AAF0DVJ9_9BASI|nr:4-carboxymuconolactone decarboxylase [Malassezia brasiliensis]
MPYRIEYASTGRASCHGPQPCAGTKIEKGKLRLGVLTEIQGHTSMIWRHWGCTTDRVLAHVKNEVEGDAKELVRGVLTQDGFEDLEPHDQASVTAAFELGRLREEDITPCLREKEEHWREREREKAEDAEADDAAETKPPKRKAPTKAAKDESDDDDLKPPPEDLPAKRTRKKPVRYAPSPKKKRRVKAEDDEGDEDEAEDDESDEEEDYGDSEDESSDVFEEDDADDDDDDEFDDDE